MSESDFARINPIWHALRPSIQKLIQDGIRSELPNARLEVNGHLDTLQGHISRVSTQSTQTTPSSPSGPQSMILSQDPQSDKAKKEKHFKTVEAFFRDIFTHGGLRFVKWSGAHAQTLVAIARTIINGSVTTPCALGRQPSAS
jgi:hypothetical protein